METSQLQKRWYNNKPLIIILLFLLPPMGVAGIFKRNTQLWKKLFYTFCAIISSFILFVITVAIFNPVDYFEDANGYYRDKEYVKAIEYYSKVDLDDPNYMIAQKRVIEIQNKLKNIEIEKQNAQTEKLQSLMAFQKKWADSILASESKPGNRHFVDIRLVLPDSIIFEYTKGITENGFDENLKVDKEFYKEHYQKELTRNFGNEFGGVKTYFSFRPNKNVDYDKILAEREAKAQRGEKIIRQFSSWDGSHRNFVRLIKDNMHDPSSFDHVETTYTDKGSYILVQMKYRGKNAFGAKVINTVNAKVDIEGNVLSVQ